jgi:hypothetical protein
MSGMGRRRFQIGMVVPRLLALVVVADVVLRFMSVDPLTFRAWEALSRFRPPGAPFEPNRQYYREQAYGDAASMGNLPEAREYHAERFTTDARGFRNVPTTADETPAAILTGDSFAVGSGVSDEEDLSSRLSQLLGCDVYNAGGIDVEPDRLLPLMHQLGMHGGLVLYIYSEDRELPVVPPDRKLTVNRILARLTTNVAPFIGWLRGLVEVSPHQILSEKAFRRLENDRILPNSHRVYVVQGQLPNGDSMVFPADRVRLLLGHREASAAYWSWLQGQLRTEQFGLLVVLVPSKYTVYRRFLGDSTPVAHPRDFLGELERRLRAAGVPAVNLTAAMSEGAARALDHHVYLYYRDDIHWNRRGTELAAGVISSSIRQQLVDEAAGGVVCAGGSSGAATGADSARVTARCRKSAPRVSAATSSARTVGASGQP